MTKEPIKVSNSEISYFEDCRRKWWLTYWRGLTPVEVRIVGPMPMGSRLHSALEVYYQGGIDSEPTGLLDAHSDLVEADRMELVMAGHNSQELDKEADLGRIMLEGYLDWVATEGLDANLDIVSVESRLSYPIIPGRVILTGKVDMLVRDRRNGTNSVVDFKTAVSWSQLLVTAAMSPQLQTYVALNLANNPDKANELHSGAYRVLRKVKRTASAKPPFYLEKEVRYSRDMLRAHWTHVTEKVTNIADARDRLDSGEGHHSVAPPLVSQACTWKCNFVNVCPMFNENEANAEQFVADNFTTHDPRAYLDGDPLVEHIKKGKGKNA